MAAGFGVFSVEFIFVLLVLFLLFCFWVVFVCLVVLFFMFSSPVWLFRFFLFVWFSITSCNFRRCFGIFLVRNIMVFNILAAPACGCLVALGYFTFLTGKPRF